MNTIANDFAHRLENYCKAHLLDLGTSDCETVLDQLYQVYAETHESDPEDISGGFNKLEDFLCTLPLDDNDAVFQLCCHLCSAYERKAFIHGLQYGVHLLLELQEEHAC